MVGAVDARALGERAGHLALEEMQAVDDALALVLDLLSQTVRLSFRASSVRDRTSSLR